MEILGYDFVQRGLLAGVLISLCASWIGVFLILRRLSLIGVGLSHSAFGGVAISFLIKSDPLITTSIFTILVGLLIKFLSSEKKVRGDNALAIIFSAGTSMAVIVMGLSRGFGEHIFSYLFGSILTVSNRDLIFIFTVFFVTMIFLLIFYRDLILTSFSEEMARLRIRRAKLADYSLMVVSSLVIVISMKAVGIVLASSIIVLPAIGGILLGGSLKGSLLYSSLLALVSLGSGMLTALVWDLPPGGTVVFVMTCIITFILLVKKVFL